MLKLSNILTSLNVKFLHKRKKRSISVCRLIGEFSVLHLLPTHLPDIKCNVQRLYAKIKYYVGLPPPACRAQAQHLFQVCVCVPGCVCVWVYMCV